MTGPGKAFRKGISFFELTKLIPDEETAIKWFESIFWRNGRRCPKCQGCNTYETNNSNGMRYRCRECKRYFSVMTGTVMQSTKLPLQKWVWAIFLELTSLKGVSSMKLHRDLGIRQPTAWLLLHKIRTGLSPEIRELFAGPVEVDEVYIGGKESNKHEDKKLRAGRGTVGKTAVIGIKDRSTNRITANVISDTKKNTIQSYIEDRCSADAPVYTDDHSAYVELIHHTSVNHSAQEWTVATLLGDLAHTNGIESFWATLRRAFNGTYHHISKKHLARYVGQFAGKHNIRTLDTLDQMRSVVLGMLGKRLRYRELIA